MAFAKKVYLFFLAWNLALESTDCCTEMQELFLFCYKVCVYEFFLICPGTIVASSFLRPPRKNDLRGGHR